MGAEIFQQYLQAPRSVLDYEGDMQQADARRYSLENMRQQNALQMLARQQAIDTARLQADDRNAIRRAAMAAGGDKAKLVQGLYSSGTAEGIKQAREQEKADAEVAEKTSKVGKETGETVDAALKRYRTALDFVGDRAGAVRWLQAQYADPTVGPEWQKRGTVEQMAAHIPDGPAFEQWRQQVGLGMEKYLQEKRQGADSASTTANRELIPDGNGGFKVNQPLIGAKQAVAAAGKTTVSVNTGQHGFDNTLKLRGDFRSEPVYKAQQEMQSAYAQIKQSLGQASPIGDTAAATKIMKLLDPGSVVRESELGMAMAASGLLDRVTNYAQNVINGTKLTPQQRKDFQALADALYGESSKSYNAKRGEYEGIANRNGLNVPDVVGTASAVPAASPGAPPKPGTVLRFDANGKPLL